MALKKLEKAQWKDTFDHLSKILIGKRAELEVASLELGDQIEAEWLPFTGIVYDAKDDIIEIVLENADHESIDHIINKPREVYIDVGGTGFRSLAITNADGVMQFVKLRDPLMLPPPAQTEGRRPEVRR